MSASRCRPWYPWFPRDFLNDENVKQLSPEGELVYRRILDALWQSKKCRIKDDIKKIYRASCKDFDYSYFEGAYKEIEEIELFIKKGGYIYSTRLLRHYNECLERSEQARKAIAKRWQKNQ